ncbi:MAG TPA: hypothetical protein VKB34_03470, partial [Povalibacter sp.]|nr:hypothetical protein [Povalibacter sp.]
GVDEIFSGLQYTDIVDYVDRSHRFVHWEHEVDLPVVQVLPDGGQLVKGRIIKLRRSKLHRTSIPGRCQMLRNYSTTRLTRPDQPSYPLLYLDDLPFPVDDILTNRRQLCDYCFFGGPDKDVPLPF